jgi:hypothetical protein
MYSTARQRRKLELKAKFVGCLSDCSFNGCNQARSTRVASPFNLHRPTTMKLRMAPSFRDWDVYLTTS